MSARSRRRFVPFAGGRVPLRTIVGASLVLALVLPGDALAAGRDQASHPSPDFPSVRLIVPTTTVEIPRVPGQPVYADPGVYLGSRGGSWQVNIARPDYGSTYEATQVVGRNGSPQAVVRQLPAGLVKGLEGLDDFFRVSIRNAQGRRISVQHLTFCPAGQDQRMDGTGPLLPTYPRICYLNPFTRGVVLGIDQGWATSALGFTGVQFRGPNGDYHLKMTITSAYRRFFGIPARDAEANVTLHVDKLNGCREKCPPRPEGLAPHRTPAGASSTTRGLTPAPEVASPPASTLPDLVALPAWNITTASYLNHDYLDFAATVWDAGPAPLLVEGFRPQGQPKMQAWQYFTNASGGIVGRLRVGELHYDARPGHEHWHFEQFARYSLLDAQQKQVVLSEKEAFCLAPTDGIDMTLPRADWSPYSTGLATACGSAQSIWVREVLPTGWGDTYLQTLPGQSFDITNLPNGTYYIAVDANPTGVLYERDRTNDSQLRKITLRGKHGARTVTVAPWHGIIN